MRWATLALGLALCVGLAACGGDGGDEQTSTGGPVLAGTPIPPVEPTPTPVPDCSNPPSLGLPPNMPSDIRTPEDYIVTKVETQPHLHVEGFTTPPIDPIEDDVRRAAGVVAQSQLINVSEAGWESSYNRGNDYTLRHSDGRVAHFAAVNTEQCLPKAALIYDFFWITP